MENFSNHIVNQNANIKHALKLLNETIKHQTLFVVNDEGQLVGTITDGDIRRGFLENLQLSDSIKLFMNQNFHYLLNEISPIKIKSFRNRFVKLLPLVNGKREILKVFDLTRLKTILPVDSVIMAGGRGERLRPLTDKVPKPMLPLGDKPIIEHNIDRLISYGIENIYISVNYLADQIMDYFGDGTSKGVNIKYIEEKKFLGTIGSVSMVTKFDNPYVLVMNSDLFTDVDLEDLWITMIKEEANLTVASIPYTVNIPFAIMDRKNGQIVGLKEKPSNTHYANAGIYLMPAEECKRIPKDSFFNATDLIEDVIKHGGKVIDNPIAGYWIDIGRHDEYNRAKELIMHKNSKK